MSSSDGQPTPTGGAAFLAAADASRVNGLYDAFYPKIYAYCVYRLFKRELAEDVTSRVFLRLVRQFDQLREQDTTSIGNWLYGTANHLVTNHIRKGRRRAEILREVAEQLAARPAANATDHMDWPVLYQAILRLRRKQQDVVVLRFFENFDTFRIAQILGIKPVTVRVLLSRALKNLRRELETPFGT